MNRGLLDSRFAMRVFLMVRKKQGLFKWPMTSKKIDLANGKGRFHKSVATSTKYSKDYVCMRVLCFILDESVFVCMSLDKYGTVVSIIIKIRYLCRYCIYYHLLDSTVRYKLNLKGDC